MKLCRLAFLAFLCFLAGCNKAVSPSSAAKPTGSVEDKLSQFAGGSATNCGHLSVGVSETQSKAASDCALQASQSKHPFYVSYDMPGMSIGVAGNADGKLYTVQSQGEGAAATVTGSDCPSELRVAASGRVTCYAPGAMGSMGAGHTAVPPGMPNPHAMPNVN